MRRLSTYVLALALGIAVIGPARAAESLFRVTLLGSGVPDPDPTRFSASTLVEAGGRRFLIDVGRGATIRLYQLHIPLAAVDLVLFTHYHSDHTVGLADLLLTGWLAPPYMGHRASPMHVIGPVGARALLSNLAAAYAGDIKGREAEQHLPSDGVAADVEEFTHDGVVYDKDEVRITAFEVEHGIKPAYGYRIDYDGRSVLLSGDTALSENLARHAEGVDLLIHEVAVTSPELLKLPDYQKIISIHTSPVQAGTLFARIHPRLAVYNHIAMMGTSAAPAPGIQDIVAQTRQTYRGPLVVGEDLMTFDIGAGGVAVSAAASPMGFSSTKAP
jgi:ribonuclease Z